jgi:hypothetical protein
LLDFIRLYPLKGISEYAKPLLVILLIPPRENPAVAGWIARRETGGISANKKYL